METTHGRDGRREVLSQKWAERLVLPGLNVARGPVVDKAQAEDVLFGLIDRDGLAKRIARADKDADF